MSRPNSINRDDVTDASVSAAYQDGDHPNVPTKLDRAVLDLAASEVRARSWLEVTNLWLRPATYVATLGLCVVLLTNIENVPDISTIDEIPPTSNPFGTERSMLNESSALRNAADQAAQQLQNAESNTGANLGQSLEDRYSIGTEDASASQSDRAIGDSCSVDQRVNVEQWHACIVNLQAAGADDLAAMEIKLLRDTFPNHRL